MHDDQLVKGVAASLALVGLGSIPAVAAIAKQFRKKEQKQDAVYEDGDGKSTPEAVKAYSAKLGKTLLLLFSAAGCGISIALAVLDTKLISMFGSRFREDWLTMAAWALLLFQAIVIASSRKSVQAYGLGIRSFYCCLVLFIVTVVQDTPMFAFLLRSYPVLFALRVIELVLVVALGVASLSLPRRPDVFQDGDKLVDRMYTVSAWTRFNFSWPMAILKVAAKKNDLDLADLPRPDQYTRAKETSTDWARRKLTSRLRISLIKAHGRALALQWFLTLCTAFLNFTPQWVILQILRIIESHTPGEAYGPNVWMWVAWLGLSIVAQSWVESYTFWLSWAELSIPVRAQLAALIFEKAMRRKDVKGSGKSKKKDAAAQSPEAAVAGPAGESTAADKPDTKQQEEDESEALKKSKQSTVNLIGVDGKRVSDFCAFQNMFPGSLFKLMVSLGFLISLLGWRALLAGFATMVAIMPINVYFSKRYSAAQDRLMKVRDEKMEVVTEALQGIRQIKFSALEPEWEKKIGAVRERELKSIWDVFVSDTMLLACWITSPILLSAVSLAVYAWLTGQLTPSVAFVSLGVFKALEVTLSVVPELTTDLVDAWVSVNRIEEYLNSAEVEPIAKHAEEVCFDNASIAWPEDGETDEADRFVLRNVTVTFPKGELSVISGKTGAGKSLMLSAILGEVDLLSGDLYVPRPPPISERFDSKANKGNWILPNSVAYVAQIPWIENASIKDNITFGLPFDKERYETTVEVCALRKDLEMLSDGENTEIGANGINLSGGQKWRVTLARAMYSRAGILVLDDIFSAVDAHVGRHIFEKCLNGELAAGRTRILVTHHVALCEPKTKYLVELGDGKVLHAGLLSDLQEDGILQQIKSHEQSAEQVREDETAATTAVNSDDSTTDGDEEEEEEEEPEAVGDALKKVASKTNARKFVEEEGREQGAVRRHIYLTYLKDSGGFIFWTCALLIFMITQALTVGRSWWLKIWTGTYAEESVDAYNFFNASANREHTYTFVYSLQQHAIHPNMAKATTQTQHSLTYYLAIYVGLALVSSVIGTLKYYYIYHGSIRASRSLFQKLNFVILRAPLRWLDTVPVGRILNRFTSDFHIIDSQLANSISFGGGSALQLIGVIVAGLFVSPLIVLLAFILLLLCLRYALRYLDGARPVKRLESTMKSPVFEQFGSALTGVATIRGFDKTQTYIERMYKKIDDYSTSTWYLWLFNRWMGWRMALIGSLFAVFVSILILTTPNIDSALAGFALAFSLDFANTVIWTIRLYANVELNMNAAERIIEYTELPTESLEGQKPPAAWPTDGRIEVDDLVVGYAKDLPPVLRGLTFNVNRNERVGVVGRTGAGKSSLTLALFRFLEARSGSIHIDGIDISKITLHELRSRLAIIPQDPVLFSGSIRSNLDPFDHHSESELRESLHRVHLVSSGSGDATPTPAANGGEPGSSAASTAPSAKNTNVFNNLDSSISEGGLNLSQGQRQLLCLARAIVSRPKVMVLDEATSAVDMTTDALIQRSIREEFTDSTLIVIAHRLSTIADFDRILVLSDGRVAEYGTPRELWAKGDVDKDGAIFRAMCEESGERDKLQSIIFRE